MLNGLVSAFAPNIYFFIVQRFLAGLFYAGTLGQMVVMAAELVGAHRRPFAGNRLGLLHCIIMKDGTWRGTTIGEYIFGKMNYLGKN